MCFTYTIQQQQCGHLVTKTQACEFGNVHNPQACQMYHRYSLINIKERCDWCHVQDAFAAGEPISDRQAAIPQPEVITTEYIQPRNVESYEVAGNRNSAVPSVPPKESKNAFKRFFGKKGETKGAKCVVM